MNKAYYSATIENFIKNSHDDVYGKVSQQYDLNSQPIQQKNAWREQIKILQYSLRNFEGKIYYEFSIPRMGKRVDNILIINNCIFIIEFKIGSSNYDKYAKEQVFNYALDMNNFHEGSHNKIIIPLLVAENAEYITNSYRKSIDNLYKFK